MRQRRESLRSLSRQHRVEHPLLNILRHLEVDVLVVCDGDSAPINVQIRSGIAEVVDGARGDEHPAPDVFEDLRARG